MLMCFMHACMYVCTLGFRFIFKQEKMYYLFQNALLNCEWFNMPFSSYSSLINLREKRKTKIEESTPFPIMYVPSKFGIYGSCSFFFFFFFLSIILTVPLSFSMLFVYAMMMYFLRETKLLLSTPIPYSFISALLFSSLLFAWSS